MHSPAKEPCIANEEWRYDAHRQFSQINDTPIQKARDSENINKAPKVNAKTAISSATGDERYQDSSQVRRTNFITLEPT